VTLFDAYVCVDWSSADRLTPAAPRRDAIWVGELSPGREEQVYVRGRHGATAHVRERLRRLARRGRRVLVGFDLPYGYPAGFAARLGLEGDRPWRAVWDAIAAAVADDEANRSTRFAAASALNARLSPGPAHSGAAPPRR